MKDWRWYIAAALFAAIALGLQQFAQTHRTLIDMLYPYVTRLIQTTLADWTSGVSFCLWQVLALLLIVALLATVVLTIVLKWNFFQWAGWVLASISLLFMLHTGVYGLNFYAGRLVDGKQPEEKVHVGLADDIRLTLSDFQTTELVEATRYFRDQADLLAQELPRDENGDPIFPSFEEMAATAGDGYKTLTVEHSFSVFAGSTAPVKKLGWADMYTAMGITGFTLSLTGEAAVNPNIPAVSLPFTMCHELAHRMCIAVEQDANLAAFLACRVHEDPAFRYSGYFMAYLYCYDALTRVGTSTAKSEAKALQEGLSQQMRTDLVRYQEFFAKNQNETATKIANSVNDGYIKANGDQRGTDSYGDVVDLLVSWHIQEIYLPAHQEEEQAFDPLDKNQVDISGLPGARD